MNLKHFIHEYPNFPKPGIMFKDISPILKSHEAMTFINHQFHQHFSNSEFDIIAGAESRGLIFATSLALHTRKGFIMIRKAGKLPGDIMPMAYDLEYGDAVMEIQRDAIIKGQRVLIVDDLLATGGTSKACGKLIETLGGIVVGYAFVVELTSLKGRDIINHNNIKSLVTYDA
jgi:adenine phosphoribosyltransferase